MNKYLSVTAFTVIAFMLLTVLIAVLVNPYDYWNTPRWSGFNSYKPAAGRHIELMKIQQVSRVSPTTIVAGNSRVDVGFDPQSEQWPLQMQPVYNFGLPGRSSARVLESLQESMKGHRPDYVLLALDFLDFRRPIGERVQPAGPDSAEGLSLKRYSSLLLSIDVLVDSMHTLLEQGATFPASWSKEGFNSLAEYHEIIANEGHKAIFDQREIQNIKNYLNKDRSIGRLPENNSEVVAVMKFLDFANKSDIKVILFVHPYHASILTAFREIGLWDEFVEWKRWMTTVAEEANLELYDFASYEAPIMEAVPLAGDTKTAMKYYWEAGHYKSALGDLVVKSLFGNTTNFGLKLRKSTIDASISQVNAAAKIYERENRTAVNRIRSRAANM